MQTLSVTRAALFRYTRPAFALAGAGAIAVSDYVLLSPEAKGTAKDQDAMLGSKRTASDRMIEQAALIPVAVVGAAGCFAVLRGHSRLIWLSHSYERWAWATAFGCLPIAAAVTAVAGSGAADGGGDADATATETLVSDAEAKEFAMLAPSAGALLAAVAGERLGSAVGRVLLPTLTGIGLLSATAALLGEHHGVRASAVLECSTLILLPALHAVCLPVYSLSLQAGLGLAWFHAAAAWSMVEDSPKATQRLLLAVGAASVLRTLCRRAPICHF